MVIVLIKERLVAVLVTSEEVEAPVKAFATVVETLL